MSTAKFEQLIDLIINEDQESAEKLFHEIVVEKSREIYESLMDEDIPGDIRAEEEGMAEDEFDGEEEMGMGGEEDMGMDGEEEFEVGGEEEFGDEEAGDIDMGSEEEVSKDDIMDIEDKLDQILAAFEEEFGSQEEAGAEEMDMGDEEGEEEAGEEEAGEEVMEAVELKKVGGETYDKFGKMGDDGANSKSPVAKKGQMGMAGKPVNFAGSSESVPSSPKAPSNYATKGETQVKGAGSFKNSPGAKVSEKGESAPKPKTEVVKAKSPVAESVKRVQKK